MARQMEGFLVGTYDDITFYKMEGEYYARMKSSLTGIKFWKHKAFAGSRRSCNRFGRGNKLASMVYREIPEADREYEVFCRMKSAAIFMIKEGKEENEITEALRGLKPLMEPIKPNLKSRKRLPAPFKKCLFRSIPFNKAHTGHRERSMNRWLFKELSMEKRVIRKALKYKREQEVNNDLNKQRKRQVDPPN